MKLPSDRKIERFTLSAARRRALIGAVVSVVIALGELSARFLSRLVK